MSNKSLLKFIKGESVVLPSNGVGVFVGIEKKELFGGTVEVYRIFFEDENLDVFIPDDKLKDSGIRKVASKNIISKIFEILAKTPKNNRGGIWNKKMEEYKAKIFSGSILLTTEVVRDGFSCTRDQNKSYTERSYYKNALARVTKEAAVVMGISYEEMENEILDILKSTQNKKAQEDDFDDEFSEFENNGDKDENSIKDAKDDED